MSMIDDLKAHAVAVKAWLVEFEQHLWHGTPAAPPMPPVPPVAPPVVAAPPVSPGLSDMSMADNSADALNQAEAEANKAS